MNVIFIINDVLWAILGGALIGLSASLLLLFNGRIAGISGIFHGLIFSSFSEKGWRFFFLVGMLLGGGFAVWQVEGAFTNSFVLTDMRILIAGFLVGVGTRLGNGCTSGHGVCGISRFSVRSIVATLVFMGAGILTVFLMGSGS